MYVKNLNNYKLRPERVEQNYLHDCLFLPTTNIFRMEMEVGVYAKFI